MSVCGECRFYFGVRDQTEAEQARKVGHIISGSCFRFPAAVPNKRPTDWCGEFAPLTVSDKEPKK